MTRPVAFKQSDLTRACRAVEDAGLKVARVILNDNGIEVVIGEPGKTKGKNPLDRLFNDAA